MKIRMTLDVTDEMRNWLAVKNDDKPSNRKATRDEIIAEMDMLMTCHWEDIQTDADAAWEAAAEEKG